MMGKRCNGSVQGRIFRSVCAIGLLAGWMAVPCLAKDKKVKSRRLELEKKGIQTQFPVNRQPRRDVNPKPKKPEDVKGPKPIIYAEETVHDFGTVWVGPDLTYSFTIKNNGDKTLEISRVKPSCGCTLAGAYPRKLEPGQSGKFPFKMKSTKLHGTFQKSVTISSNDPITPSLRLQLKGQVKQYVDVSPRNANFGRLIGQEAKERVLNITNNTEKPLELKLADNQVASFDVQLVEKEPGKKYELRVKAQPPFSPGNLRADIRLQTNIEKQKEVKVTARAVVPERIDVSPSVITYSKPKVGAGQESRGLTRVVRVTNYGDAPVKVTEVTVDDPEIKVTLNERTAGKAYTVLVQMPPGYEPPANGRTITIKTDDKGKPKLTVPIRGPRRPQTAQRRRPAEGLVGKPAPSFALTTTAGKSITNDKLKDEIFVLDFFAYTCGFCKKQIPRLEPIRKLYANKGVRFIAVAEAMRGRKFPQDVVQKKLDELNFRGELAMDMDNKVGPKFKATSFPTMVVLGKSGKVEAVNVGNIGDLEKRLKGQLDALIAGKPVPTFKSAAAQRPTPARADSLIGKRAPKFATKTLDGKPLSNSDLAKNAATVLNFFAPNCGFCKKQIPRLETVRQKYADKGVRFVNVSQKMRKEFTQDQVVAKMTELGFKGELAIDHTNTIGGKFNARGFPTMVIVGKDGKVKAANIGNVADLEARLAGQLDALIAGKPIPAKYATKPSASPKPSRRRPAEGLVGKSAPRFAAKTVDGKEVSSKDFANHPATVLNFVAPNCGFCKRQLPNVEKVRKEYEAKGVRFVNVAQTMRKEYTLEDTIAAFEKTGARLEMVKDGKNEIGQKYKAVSYPTMIVVDKGGKISYVNVGAKPNMESLLKGQLDALIKKSK